MGSLIKDKAHELVAFDYSNISVDILGNAGLASRNLNPDALFRITNPNGKMKYFKLGHPPKPDGWGVYVKGPAASDDFSEQNGYPLPLGDTPFYDLDHPLVNGQPLPEAKDYVDIAQPEAPRTVIFVTGDKGYPTGWYCVGYAWRMRNANRITTPDPDTAGFAGTRSEPFQMSGSLGAAFYIPTPPKDAVYIVFYLTNVQATSSAALNAPFFEQFAIKIEDNRSNIVEFRGPLQTGTPARTSNKTKIEEWGGPGGFDVDTERSRRDNDAYDVQFAYELNDETGHSVGTTSRIHHMGQNSHKHYRFRPSMSSLNDTVKDSIKGWTPYVRYRKGGNWGKWQTIKKKGGDNVYGLRTWVPVFGAGWRKDSPYDLAKGEPDKKDTSGIPNPTEPMTQVDTTIALNSSGLVNGKHRIKTVLYDGDEPSEPSEASVVDITASNQVPRIYQPFFTNRLDNPDLIDTAGTTSRPRDWTFNRDARTTYEKGKVTVDETDGQTTRGDLIVTPYGYIALGEFNYNGRVVVEIAKHVTGKAVDVLMEYHINSYSATGVPNVTFIKQSTLGVHRRNGRYQLGFRTGSTRARDAIPLDPTTNLVVIKTIGDGSDPNLGVRNYQVFRKGHGIFHTMNTLKRKTIDEADKVDWWEPDEQSYPHGGYAKVINNGDDPTIQGVTMNMTDTGISIPTNTMLTGTSETEKTIEVRFRTGEDISTIQNVYRQGNGTQGYAIQINGGNLHFRVWQASGASFVNLTTALQKHEKYLVTLVRSATAITCYVNGVQVATSATAVPAFQSNGTASAGYNTGTVRTSGNTTSTTVQAMLGRMYEIRVWNAAKPASFILSNWDNAIEDADDKVNLALYLRMTEMEGTTTYDKSGNASDATLVGDFRWINGDFNAAWRDGSGMIDRVNYFTGNLPSPWTLAGTGGVSTVGDFSASRFSTFGQRLTGTGTNTRYITRTVPGGYTTFAEGEQFRFITLPTGTTPTMTLLQLVDATGVVGEVQLNGTQLQFRGPGAGAWFTFLSGLEAGERLYVELKAEGLGTAAGILRVYVGATHEEEFRQVGMLSALNFTSRNVTTTNAGAIAVTGTISNTWELHLGEVILSTKGKVFKEYLPGNYVEYYGPDGTPPNEQYGLYDLGIPLRPGDVMTHSVYATCSGLVAGEEQLLGATIYNKDDEEIDQLSYLVDFDDIESEWKRYTQTFTVPADAAYMMYDRNNVGQGTYRIQALQVELGSSATAFTARHTTTGYVRVKFDSITPGCEPGKPMDMLGKVEALQRMGFLGYEDNNTTITLQIASAATQNGTYSSYSSDVATVPKNRWYEVKATLTTTDLDISPVLTGIYLNFKRAYPMVHKPNGEEYQGGTLINNMPPPLGRRLVEIHQMDDGSGGFTTWGSENPTRWIEPFELHVFRDSTADEISSNVGEDESTFMIEYYDALYEVRVVEPIEFEIRRRSKITLADEDEDFFWYTATIPRGEVIGIQDI